MNIGVRIPCPEPGLDIDPAVVAATAERLGFDSIWYPEHAIMPVQTSSPFTWSGSDDGSIPPAYGNFVDPLVALARASAVTTRLMLGTGILLLPEHNPLLLAKQTATLDRVSGGRLLLGVGGGWLREQTEIMGGDFDRRWRQTREATKVLKTLWCQEPAEFHGEYYDFPPVRSLPKPVRDPHPPVLLAGEHERVYRRVAEWGDGWIPSDIGPEVVERGRKRLDECAERCGRDPEELEITAYYVPPYRDDVQAMFDAGANRVVVKRVVTAHSEADIVADLEAIAERVL